MNKSSIGESRNVLWLLVCFDPREIKALSALLVNKSEHEINGSIHPLVCGFLESERVGLMRLPFGDKPQLLKDVTESLLDAVRPQALVALGTCMALGTEIEVGSVAINRRATYGNVIADFDNPLVEQVLAVAPRTLKIRRTSSITTDVFIDSAEAVTALKERPMPPDVVEMEDYHLARLADQRGIPFLSVRGITDRGDFSEHMAHVEEASRDVIRVLRRTLRHWRQRRMLVSVENPSTALLPFRFVVRALGRLSCPEGARAARLVTERFRLAAFVPPDGRVDIRLTIPGQPSSWSGTPSGLAKLLQGDGLWALAHCPKTGYTRVVVDPEFLETVAAEPLHIVKDLAKAKEKKVKVFEGDYPRDTLPPMDKVHIQGLNSMSAEASEGLLAAPTVDEFADSGVEIGAAYESRYWIYRTANAADSSYFFADYATPRRRTSRVPLGTYLIATGLGPAIDPEAKGGSDGRTLLLGDEQGGRLLQYIDDLSERDFGPEDVFRYQGVIQRIGDDTVVLSRVDRRLVLSPRGFDELRFNPRTVRQMYASTYDEFLGNYFTEGRKGPAPRVSHLFTTSRGCGNRCSICCCGGHQPFSALSVDTMIATLRRIAAEYGLEGRQFADIYLLDSNFNKDANRVIDLADRLESENLQGKFRFFVRHNSLQPFLLREFGGKERRRVNRSLVSAYVKLGIHEVVMGVDAFTTPSILTLKGDVSRLKSMGCEARLPYDFGDIEAVLKALEFEGLDSRCFILRNNPFVDDGDRVETYYNLACLALEVPGFRLDTESAESVNELKIFPGSPLARVAAAVPGLARDGHFRVVSQLGAVEELMDIAIFRNNRRKRGARGRFLKGLQTSRLALAEFLESLLNEAEDMSPQGQEELGAALAAFINGEERLEPLIGKGGRGEGKVKEILEYIKKRSMALNLPRRKGLGHRTERFLELLQGLGQW